MNSLASSRKGKVLPLFRDGRTEAGGPQTPEPVPSHRAPGCKEHPSSCSVPPARTAGEGDGFVGDGVLVPKLLWSGPDLSGRTERRCHVSANVLHHTRHEAAQTKSRKPVVGLRAKCPPFNQSDRWTGLGLLHQITCCWGKATHWHQRVRH